MSERMTDKISSAFYDLSDAERRVAECVMRDPGAAQYLSITELATEAGVSDATVTRFCRKLGQSGFYAFKLELAKTLHTKPEKRGVDAEISVALNAATAALNATAEALSKTSLQDAVQLLTSADRVLCAGSGGSMLIAMECAHLFATASNKFTALSDTHMQLMALASMKAGDVLLLASFSGATKDGMELIRCAKRYGIKVVLLTGFASSPLGERADVVLCCAAHESPYEGGSMPARMAQLLTIDTLYRTYCDADTGAREQALRIAEALSEQHL